MTPPRLTVHAALARRAAVAPDALAIVHGDERVDYATLTAAASALARRLADWGVRSGDVVPLVMPRSAHLIAVQLGALMCGAAYTGIDPRWPVGRIESILGQLDGPVVIGRAGDDAVGVTRTLAPAPLAEIAAELPAGGAVEPAQVGPDHPATVFFTSGTTGVSKGVVVPHRAVTRLFGAGGLSGFGPGHATPQAAPVPWDMYAFEVWGQLTTGGACIVVDEDHLMPRRLRDLVGRERVDTVWLTTSLFNLFVDEDLDSFAGVRRLYVGGEKQSPKHVAAFLERFPDLPVWNGYGPAENCMLTTLHRMTRADLAVPGGIPVGRAVTGTAVVLMREDGSPAPDGDTGEVLAVGDGVALGYLNDEALTRERFVRVDIDGRSYPAYRTGDIGLIDSDGVLHYRGRRDRQIKLHGNRIELGDIEAAAARVAQVRACAAVAVSGEDGQVDGVLLFYSVAEGAQLPPRELRRRLAALLPAYALPSSFEQIDDLPRSANGKVDLQALSRRVRR